MYFLDTNRYKTFMQYPKYEITKIEEKIQYIISTRLSNVVAFNRELPLYKNRIAFFLRGWDNSSYTKYEKTVMIYCFFLYLSRVLYYLDKETDNHVSIQKLVCMINDKVREFQQNDHIDFSPFMQYDTRVVPELEQILREQIE